MCLEKQMYHLVKPAVFLSILVTVLVLINSKQNNEEPIMKTVVKTSLISFGSTLTYLYFTDTVENLDNVMSNIIKTAPEF